jgi:hypothetical protein
MNLPPSATFHIAAMLGAAVNAALPAHLLSPAKPRYVPSGENYPGQRRRFLVGAWRGDSESYTRPTRQLLRQIERADRKRKRRS